MNILIQRKFYLNVYMAIAMVYKTSPFLKCLSFREKNQLSSPLNYQIQIILSRHDQMKIYAKSFLVFSKFALYNLYYYKNRKIDSSRILWNFCWWTSLHLEPYCYHQPIHFSVSFDKSCLSFVMWFVLIHLQFPRHLHLEMMIHFVLNYILQVIGFVWTLYLVLKSYN